MSERIPDQLSYVRSSLSERTAAELEKEALDWISFLECEAIYAGCESPIEVAFLHALLGICNMGPQIIVLLPAGKVPNPDAAPRVIFIEPQKQIGDYRVDFLVSANGPPQIVVECDGHDFHERTADQAERDRKRDRDLQAAGYKVFRFTGREIFRSAVSCALEVQNFLSRAMR